MVHVKIILNGPTHVALLVKYIYTHKKIQNIWCTFYKGKKNLNKKKKTCSHPYFKCFKHTK